MHDIYTYDRILDSYQYQTPFNKSPSFLLLLLSLMRQRQTPDTTQVFHRRYDYVIVGGGTAGSVVASRLSEKSCVDVLLLEAGKRPPVVSDIPIGGSSLRGSDLDWKYKTTPQKHTASGIEGQRMVWPSGKVLGGCSIINAMLVVRGNKNNYDDWEKHGATGWGYKDVLEYFLKMEDNQDQDVINTGYHARGGPVTIMRPRYNSELKEAVFRAAKELKYPIRDVNGARQTGFYDYQLNMRDGQRCSMAKAYLVPAEDRRNLDIVVEARVTKILISNGKAVGVMFDHYNTTQIVYANKEVIMSAGTINTAQLLMLSGIGPREELMKHGIPVIADLQVGRNLQDHLTALVTFTVNDDIPQIKKKLTDEKNIQDYINFREGPLTGSKGVASLAFLSHHEDDDDRPDFQLYFIKSDPELYPKGLGLKEEIYKAYFKPYENSTVITCDTSILHPKSRGTVTLQSSNPYDPPVINPNYFHEYSDVNDVVQGMLMCNVIARTKAMKNIGTKPFELTYPGCEHVRNNEYDYMECQARSFVTTLNHQVGTAKMGQVNDPTTVVSPELRVKGIEGLRVVDASVMPLVPSGNTNIPTTMVAEKASDIIKKDIWC